MQSNCRVDDKVCREASLEVNSGMNNNLQRSGSDEIDLLLEPAIDNGPKQSNKFIVIDHRFPQWDGAIKKEVPPVKEQFTFATKPDLLLKHLGMTASTELVLALPKIHMIP